MSNRDVGNDKIKATLRLIERSPDCGDGWRNVSKTVWPLVVNMPADLVDLEPGEGGGGRIRMRPEGRAVLTYA